MKHVLIKYMAFISFINNKDLHNNYIISHMMRDMIYFRDKFEPRGICPLYTYPLSYPQFCLQDIWVIRVDNTSSFTDQTVHKVRYIVRDRGIGPYRTRIGLASYSLAPCDMLVLFDSLYAGK